MIPMTANYAGLKFKRHPVNFKKFLHTASNGKTYVMGFWCDRNSAAVWEIDEHGAYVLLKDRFRKLDTAAQYIKSLTE